MNLNIHSFLLQVSLAHAMNSQPKRSCCPVCASFVCVNPLALHRTTRTFGNGRPSLGSSARTKSGPLLPISRMRRHKRPTPDPPPKGVTVTPAPISRGRRPSRYASRPPPEGVTVRYASRAPAPPPPGFMVTFMPHYLWTRCIRTQVASAGGVTVRYASRAPAPPPPDLPPEGVSVKPAPISRGRRPSRNASRPPPEGVTVRYARREPAPPPPRMTVSPGVPRRSKIRVETAATNAHHIG
jgi:hypothetical protein